MNRAQRRTFEKNLQKLLRTDGDNCSGCRRLFIHNEPLTYGVDRSESAAVVGDCCKNRLSLVFAQGVFVNRHGQELIGRMPVGNDGPVSNLAAHIAKMQDGIRQLDKMADDLMRQAGVSPGSGSINSAESSWKFDDASWFENNPERSRRLRDTFAGELDHTPLSNVSVPAGHRLNTIVRQVSPGVRVRSFFARNIEVPLPDIEALLHALFDRVSAANGSGAALTSKELVELALGYEASARSRPN